MHDSSAAAAVGAVSAYGAAHVAVAGAVGLATAGAAAGGVACDDGAAVVVTGAGDEAEGTAAVCPKATTWQQLVWVRGGRTGATHHSSTSSSSTKSTSSTRSTSSTSTSSCTRAARCRVCQPSSSTTSSNSSICQELQAHGGHLPCSHSWQLDGLDTKDMHSSRHWHQRCCCWPWFCHCLHWCCCPAAPGAAFGNFCCGSFATDRCCCCCLQRRLHGCISPLLHCVTL